ncbi:MAG: hypothetical protein J6X86_02765 [Bacteroidales bacterium]|nr:hypothetical protein [Bacteroidales bacterium]
MKTLHIKYGIVLGILLAMSHFAMAQNPLFGRYAQRDELTVAQVTKYRVDSVTAVDVVLIHANDSSAWISLLKEMDFPDITIKNHIICMEKGWSMVAYNYCKRNHPEVRVSLDEWDEEFDLVFFSTDDKTIYVFEVETEEQAKKITGIYSNKLFKKYKK